MKRREFIILTGAGASSTALLSACGHPEEKLVPALVPVGEYVPGIDNWKASTCQMCSAGCGIVVRSRDHKANKIEGNPLHPVNRGALCASGQAGLEVLYNPDRIKAPMKRVGERGEGKWQEITWDEAIGTLADKLRGLDRNRAVFMAASYEGINNQVARRVMEGSNQSFVPQRSFDDTRISGGDILQFGSARPGSTDAIFDIANATYLLSFGARFLEAWRSPVMYSQAYGVFRDSREKQRGRFIQIEPRMSLTGANADEWVPAAPGTEALLARAIAQVIIREGLNKTTVSADVAKKLEDFSPERMFSSIDVPAERIIRLAREFATSARPLAIGPLQLQVAVAVNALNELVGNLNKPGGVLVHRLNDDLAALVGRDSDRKAPDQSGSASGQSSPRGSNSRVVEPALPLSRPKLQAFQVMLFHGTIPRQVRAIPFVASFSMFMDEATELADLVLPDNSHLESWNIQSSYGPDGRTVVSLTQPVVSPEFNTRQTADVLLALARELGGAAAVAVPFESARQLLEKRVADFAARSDKTDSAALWKALTDRGLLSAGGESNPTRETLNSPRQQAQASFAELSLLSTSETRSRSELTLMVYEPSVLGNGGVANLPSIQELPDSMTSVVWGNWVEINPVTAASLGIGDGDIVEVTTAHGSLTLPALLYPAIRPDVVAIPSAQGPSNNGRYARQRGPDPTSLISFEGESIEFVPVRVSRGGGKGQLIRIGIPFTGHKESRR